MILLKIVFLTLINLYLVHSVSVVTTVNNNFKNGENPDAYLTTPQIIRRHGYASQSHVIETEDGYLLTLHRIAADKRGRKGNQPVFLQHGLLSSSTDWVDGGENALAFILADVGYDVWLGNARGNVYSTAHVSLLPSSPQFWNFSFHEMGIQDVPSSLKYISDITGKGGNIIYLGHSMGTTMFFVFSSLLPEQAKLVEVMIAFAPVAYMTHMRSPIRYLAPFSYDIEWLAKNLGFNQFLPENRILRLLTYECTLMKYAKEVCENIIFALCGFDKQQFDTDLLPVVLSHTPAGTSTKTVIHYTQEIANKGNFQAFDYGRDGNLKQYGTETPPLYNLTSIGVPIYLMYGDNDLMVSSVDVFRLAKQLPNNVGTYEVPLKSFNHVDFLWARDAPKLVYGPLLKFLENYRK